MGTPPPTKILVARARIMGATAEVVRVNGPADSVVEHYFQTNVLADPERIMGATAERVRSQAPTTFQINVVADPARGTAANGMT